MFPFRHRIAVVALATACLATLSGCGGPRLAAEASPAAELRGSWRLDPAASDDARAIIAAALPKPRGGAASRRDAPESPANGGAAGAFARAFAEPATTLRIGGSPREIVIEQDGRRRRLSPGDETPHSVTDRFGTRSVRAGWEREEFVIVSRNASGFELVERFRRGAAPDTLATTVTLKARGLDTIRVQSLYRRAPDVERAPSAADGPPAPLR